MKSESYDPAAMQARPLGRKERIVALDFIRGIAVLGILLANIVPFGQPDIAGYWPPAISGGDSAADRTIWLLQLIFVDGKFRGLFTVLFGASLMLFLDRFEERGDATFLQVRRLVWLALLGALHFALLFEGDILFAYASAGIVVLFVSGLSAKELLALGICGSIVGGLLRMSSFGTGAALEIDPDLARIAPDASAIFREYWQERLATSAAQAEIWAQGSWFDVVRYRVVEDSDTLLGYLTFNFYETIPLMILGMGLYRSGLFALAEGPPASWLRFAIGGVLVTAFLHLSAGLWVVRHGFPIFTTQFVYFGVLQVTNLPMIVCYVVLLCALAPRCSQGWIGRRLVAAGRTAFTNYIGTSLVMMAIFQGWGLGLFGMLHRPGLLLVVILGWVLMLAWPVAWLHRYRQGPLEYVWRCLTYWKVFPNRR